MAERLGSTEEKRKLAEMRSAELEAEGNQSRIALSKARFLGWFVLVPALISTGALAVILVLGLGGSLTPYQRSMVYCIVAGIPLLTACWSARVYIKGDVDMEAWWLPVAMQKLGWLIGFLVLMAFEGVYQGQIYDAYKELRGQ